MRHFKGMLAAGTAGHDAPSGIDAGPGYAIRDRSFRLKLDDTAGERPFPGACRLDRVTPGESRDRRPELRRTS